MASTNHTKKLLTLGIAGVALLLIPRRSSRKADKLLSKHSNSTKNTKNKDKDSS